MISQAESEKGMPETTKSGFSLHRLLRNVTDSTQVTTMTEREKFHRLLSVFLGNQSIRGGFRPRDLFFDPVAIEAIGFATRVNQYRIKLPKKVDEKAFSCFINKPVIALSDAAVDGGVPVGELVYCIGLALMEKYARDGDSENIRRCYRAATNMLLRLVENFPKEDAEYGSWPVDVSHCRVELEVGAADTEIRLRDVVNRAKGGPEIFGVLVLSILNRTGDTGKYNCFGIRCFDINHKFLDRWKRSSMRRGASYMVYAAIAILREKLIDVLGPACILHDFGGGLTFIAPASAAYQFDEKWIDESLSEAFKESGWMQVRFREILGRGPVKKAFSDQAVSRDSFPQMAVRNVLGTELDLNGLRGAKLPKWPELNNNGAEFKSQTVPCKHCDGRHPEVEGRFVRYRGKDKDPQGCAICTLIADGTAPWWRHHMWASAVAGTEGAQKKAVAVHFHLEASKNVSRDEVTEYFCADGDGVGRIVHSKDGIHALRNIALLIHSDIQERLVEAVGACLAKAEDAAPIGFELCWIGGDDLMLRIHPDNHDIFKRCFEREVIIDGSRLTFTTGEFECAAKDSEMINGMAKAMAILKSRKELKKA